MYTRSYPSHPRTGILPPDYGGTALTVSPPPVTPEPPVGGERPRRPLETEARESSRPEHSPFGGNGQPDAHFTADNTEKEAPVSLEKPHFPDPSSLKTDDLLLLGLILMLLFDNNEGDSGREAILLLVVLYLSGI